MVKKIKTATAIRLLSCLLTITLTASVSAQSYPQRGRVLNSSRATRSANQSDLRESLVNGVANLFKKKDKSKDKKQSTVSATKPLAEDDVELVVCGNGTNKEEATKVALRSAIEQTYGVFVSSNTEILNDELVKDEIATITSGNIKHFEYISETVVNGMTEVNIKAIVSIGKLVSYAKSKGSSAELAGATFAMNVKMAQLNLENQKKALHNLVKQCENFLPLMFDYEISSGEPRKHGDKYIVPISVKVTFNENALECQDLFVRTMCSLAVSKREKEAEKNYMGFDYISIPTGYFTPELKDFIQPLIANGIVVKRRPDLSDVEIILRSDEEYIERKGPYEKIFGDFWSDAIWRQINSFVITDNLGNTDFLNTSYYGSYQALGQTYNVKTPIQEVHERYCYRYPIFKTSKDNYLCTMSFSREYSIDEISRISKFDISRKDVNGVRIRKTETNE